jgi:hypothetical protein
MGESHPLHIPRMHAFAAGTSCGVALSSVNLEEADVSECHFLIKETIHLPLSFDLS